MTKLIALSGKSGQGLFAIVDDEDFDFLNQWKWKPNNRGNVLRIVTLKKKDQPTKYSFFLMGRVVAKRSGMNIDSNEVDHIDRNKLNNTRNNLRPATRLQNCWNMKRNPGSTGLVGAIRRGNRFAAMIRVGNGNRIKIGIFDTPEEAHAAYIKAANERSEFSAWIAEDTRAAAETRLANAVWRAMVEGEI